MTQLNKNPHAHDIALLKEAISLMLNEQSKGSHLLDRVNNKSIGSVYIITIPARETMKSRPNENTFETLVRVGDYDGFIINSTLSENPERSHENLLRWAKGPGPRQKWDILIKEKLYKGIDEGEQKEGFKKSLIAMDASEFETGLDVSEFRRITGKYMKSDPAGSFANIRGDDPDDMGNKNKTLSMATTQWSPQPKMSDRQFMKALNRRKLDDPIKFKAKSD